MSNFSEVIWKSDRASEAMDPTNDQPPPPQATPVASSTEVEVVSPLRYAPVDRVEVGPKSRIGLLTDPNGATADRFRFLRMRLREFKGVAKLQSIVITSPLPEDGKSTIAMSLATALAEGGKLKTLLIEADLHHPTIAECLNLPARTGLSECLEEGLDPMASIRRVEPLGWYLLQAGETRGNRTELLQTSALPAVLQRVTPHFDWVLIDTPPVLPLTDALALSRQVDATLLVARAGSTPREAIDEALRLIGRKHVLGIILNGAEGLTRLYSKYSKYYQKR
jgi:succinoglycan biosynthesis transport protein ExoP